MPLRRGLILGVLAIGTLRCGGDSGGTTQPQNVPRISLTASTANFNGVAGGANPTAVTVSVTNSGTGTLSALATGAITYGSGQPQGWLSAQLGGTTAPAVLTLTTSLGTLPAGSYTATVPITSAAASVANSPQTIAVTLTVAQPAAVLTSIIVSLSAATVDSGATSTATAAGRDQFGAPIAIGAVTWSSTANGVATVSSGGVVSAIAPGQATIRAALGAVAGTAALTVRSKDPSFAACRLPVQFGGANLGFPRVAGRMKAVGDVRIPVVFVDFSDAPATRTTQNVFGLMSPTAENYYKTVSYGRMNLILQPNHAWVRMSKPSPQYGWNALTYNAHKAYIEEALNLATTADLSQADGFLIMSNPDAGALTNGPAFVGNPGSGVTVRGKTLNNGATSGRDLLMWNAFWVNHELGHALGLPDLYSSADGGHHFVGNFSLMGLISAFAPEYFAWERWQLGWIDDTQVSCASQPGTKEVSLSPVERVGGTKMIVIPTGVTTALLVESRRAEGYDTHPLLKPGVLVYSIDTSVFSGNGVLKVLPINDADPSKSTAPLSVGGSMTIGGVTITFVSTDANGDLVRVTR